MSIEDMTAGMKDTLSALQLFLQEARVEMVRTTAKVAELERQEMALQSALDILEGKSVFRQMAEGTIKPTGKFPAGPRSADLGRGTESRIETVEGIEYVIEPGFELSKNSFGEISILPVGTKMEPMAEPTKPVNVALVLPPVSAGEGFGSPEDQL
jgi:hypothetical protein